MAAVVDFGAITPEKGIYGLYNDFFVRITRTVSTGFKLKYRIKTTVIAETSYTTEQDITPIDEVGIVNPVLPLKDTFFRTQVVGLNGNVLDDSATVDVANFGCNRITIEVGEIYSAAADDPAVFQGYDTSTNITFYNGYENVNIENTTTDYENYLDPGWYDNATVKLNHTILNRKISNGLDDENKVFAPAIIERTDDTYEIDAIYTDSYDSNGILDNQDIEPFSSPAAINGYQVFNFLKQSAVTTGLERVEMYFRYTDGVTNLFSEKISFTYFESNQHERYRLRWFNRYGTFEYLNCNGRFVETVNITKGKEILTDALDLTATTFASIKNVATPELRETGKEKEILYSLYTNYLNEEEQQGLKEIVESPNVIMYDPDNNIIPVIPSNTTLRIASVKDELIQYEIRLKLANRGKILGR